MIRRIFTACLLLSLVGCSQPHVDPKPQDHAKFTRALLDESTAPYYVRLVVIDGSTEESYVTCKTANIFKGALHLEKRLGYDEASVATVIAFALQNKHHTFAFSNSEALKYMRSSFTAEELNAVNLELSRFSSGEIAKGMALDGFVTQLYRGRLSSTPRFDMDAVACSLIERGLEPRSADVIAALRL